jgi:hypothetical protein
MHGMGAIRGWLEVNSPHKWLRWHPYQESYGIWGNQEARLELVSFFDRYLKRIENDWESTTHVRMAILKYGATALLENLVYDDFPLPRTVYKKLTSLPTVD